MKIPFLDFAKGYAILTIVFYHAMQKLPLSPLLQKAVIFGGTGVHLFFLLSGFGLGLSVAREGYQPLAVGNFYNRRLRKIWLPYALALTISLGAAWAFGLFSDGWAAWLAGVGLYQMFSEHYILSFGGHFWFISAIVQFYLVFPALVWLRRKSGNGLVFLGVTLLLSMAWWLLVFMLNKGDLRNWNSFFLQFLWEFALGMVLAEYFLKPDTTPKLGIKGDFWNYKWWVYLPIGLTGTGLMVFIILKMGELGRVFNDIPALIGYTALCIFLFRLSEQWLPPVKSFFLWIGSFSFSLYLMHVLVLVAFIKILAINNQQFSLIWIPPYILLALLAGRAFEPLSEKMNKIMG